MDLHKMKGTFFSSLKISGLAIIIFLSGCAVQEAVNVDKDTFKESTTHQDFIVFASPREVTSEQAIEWVRSNGDYAVVLEEGDLMQSLLKLGIKLKYTLRVDREVKDREYKFPKKIEGELYPVPYCISWNIPATYTVGTNDFVKTLNHVLEQYNLKALYFANDVLLVASTLKYKTDFCTGR
jgi:hypothetical protein